MIDSFVVSTGGHASPERLVEVCLDQMGAVQISHESQGHLVAHAARDGSLEVNGEDAGRRRVAEMFQLIAATPEFQKG